jgi:hypothetical protein
MQARETNDPVALALGALVWTLQDEARAERLLAVTGLDPDILRAGVNDPAVLSGVLAFLEQHEPDLIACAAAINVKPEQLITAAGALAR